MAHITKDPFTGEWVVASSPKKSKQKPSKSASDEMPEWLAAMPQVTQDRFMAWVDRTSLNNKPAPNCKTCGAPAWVTLNREQDSGPFCFDCAA